LTAALNIFKDNTEKTAKIIEYANSKGITVQSPRFGKSRSGYSFDRNTNTITKGLSSIKYLNTAVAEESHEVGQNDYQNFMDVLMVIKNQTSINSRQIDVLIKLDFFQAIYNNVQSRE
jgi:DNA polymerase-3 subunit alpha